MLVLDVGSGARWPGIYRAATTGARVILTDILLEGWPWPPVGSKRMT